MFSQSDFRMRFPGGPVWFPLLQIHPRIFDRGPAMRFATNASRPAGPPQSSDRAGPFLDPVLLSGRTATCILNRVAPSGSTV